MAPMVSTVHEAAAFEAQVKSHGLPVGGIMIEVPAAALRAPHLIEKVDFFSHRHQRPHPVRDGHRPDGRASWPSCSIPGSRRSST